MAKLEIPSIVVDKGNQLGSPVSAPPKMESQRSIRAQRTFSKQEEIDEEDHSDMLGKAEVYSPCVTGPEELQQIPPSRPSTLNMIHRSRSQSKVKLLVRSHAMREESPEGGVGGSDCEGEGSRIGRHRLRREGSSTDQTSWSEPALSRGNSREQYDGSNNPIDLHQFIIDTLNRNYKDRMLLFKIENELMSLSKDPKRSSHKFNQMSSYQRMLVHRVAAYFGMEHNVDNTGMSVIVNTTKNTRLPDRRFRDYVREDLLEEPRRSILKRDSSSFDESASFKSGERFFNEDTRRSKSFEEREEEYEKVRRRIFNHEHLTDADLECMEEYHHSWDTDGCPRCAHHSDRGVRLLKVESYESGDTLKANSLRLSVSKSHSFNGYDQSNPTQPPRVLTKQDSGSSMSSRISPSQSSGYKSQRSDATLSATPSPTATPSLHAQSGQPYTNSDGSIYHYDPSNPPHSVNETVNHTAATIPQVSTQPQLPQLIPPKQVMEENGLLGGDKMGSDRGILNGGSRFDALSLAASYAPVTASSAAGMYAYGHAPPPQHQLPLVVPPHPPDQYHLYQTAAHHCPTAAAPPPPSPDPRLAPTPENVGMINSELSACMMGMSLDTRTDRQQPLMYWQPHHIQGSIPMYYSSTSHVTAGTASARYHQAVTPATPFSQIIPHQLPPPPPSIDHSVGGTCLSSTGYGGGPGSTECSIASYPSAIHMYYPACSSAAAASAAAAATTYYTPTSISPQPPPPCPHPSSPQLTVYNGCYPTAGTHYSTNSTTITAVPQIFRKPSLQQVGVGCNSSLRSTGYHAMSSSIKDRSLEESKIQAQTALHSAPMPPFYGIRVLPTGDVRLFNPGRLPFAVQTSKPINRKHKFKMGGGSLRNYGGEGGGNHSGAQQGTQSHYVPGSSSDLTKA